MKVEILIATIDNFFSDITRNRSETQAGLEQAIEHMKILIESLFDEVDES